MFFVQVKAAGRYFNLKATCGGCDSFLISLLISKILFTFAMQLFQFALVKLQHNTPGSLLEATAIRKSNTHTF